MTMPLRVESPRQHSCSELRAQIDQRLSTLPLPLDLPELIAPIRQSLRPGGKRIRPTLLLMCHELYDSPSTASAAMSAALAVEVLHNFTLLHDDVLDDSPVRRNAPTVHARWSRDVAILSGDAMSVLALHLATECPAHHIRPVLDVLCHSAYQMCQSEQLDLLFESEGYVPSKAYRDMVSRKTGALLGAACRLGGLLAGASTADQQSLERFGTQLGVAFQIQDDVLDVFGDAAEVGKRCGGDILRHKKSYPILRFVELASKTELVEMRCLLGSSPQSERACDLKISSVLDLLNGCNVEQETRAEAATIHHQALRALDQLSVSQTRTGPLRALVESLRCRKQ